MPINLTDAETAFADSAEGKYQVAGARSNFELAQAHKGDYARKWTDAEEAVATRRLSAVAARTRVGSAALMADAARQIPATRAAEQTARAVAEDRLRNGWRQGR